MSGQKIRITFIGLLTAALLAVAGGVLATDTGTTTLVSRHTDGTVGDGESGLSDISPDGRYVLFTSWGGFGNLVDNDANGGISDVFLHDRQTGETTIVSLAQDGAAGNSDAGGGRVSADGRYVFFHSDAMNLVPGDVQFYGDVDTFILDRQTGQLEMWMARHTNGTPANRAALIMDWTPDRRYLVYDSGANNLVDDDTNGIGNSDVFVNDTQTGETTLVSRHSDGTPGDNGSYMPDISDDGRYVTFASDADNLVDTPVTDVPHIYIHDRQTGETVLASRNSDGTPADAFSYYPSISGDGRYVAFQSQADNLVAHDTDARQDIFIHDRVTGQTISASQNSFSSELDFGCVFPQMSNDGRYVSFMATEPLTADDDNVYEDIVVYDRVLNSWTLVSRHSDGTQTDNDTEVSAISADGQVIAFASYAGNLVDNDDNDLLDVFVHELAAPVAPVAAFTASPLSGAAPLVVNFTDQSTNSPTSWNWNFGDGGTATQRHPSHTYTTPGTYTVSLTATNAAGSDGETKTAYVTVTTPPASPSLYVSPTANGTVGGSGGVAATAQDILFRNGPANTWAMHFDGSDVGVTKAITAFARMSNGDLLLSFKANVTLPGVGAVTPWDVVRFSGTYGNATSGTFSWYIDGGDVGLTTAAEKIDALDVLSDGKVVVSTGGALSAPKTNGGTLKTQDEDLAVLNHTSLGATTAGTWDLYFDGTAVPGLKAEDVTGAHVDAATGERYISILGAFNVGGVSGNDKDVLKLTPAGGGGYTVSLYWRGGNQGFNLNIGGVELP